MNTAIQIANFFIEKHKQDKGCPIDHIKLQKLVYISYGWYWAILQKILFKDKIQAWKYGPVIPEVWREFKNQSPNIEDPSGRSSGSLDQDTEKVLILVYKAYINQGSVGMVVITHAHGTPWSMVYDDARNKEIPEEMIWRYYEVLYSKLKKATQK